MADYFDAGKFGAVIAIPFHAENATTGASNIDMTVTVGGDTLAVMPAAGSIVAISARANATVNAGTVTLKAHSNSTEFTDTGIPAPAIGTAGYSYATVRPGAVTFAAGARLGLSYSATTTLDPTDSLDVDALLFVQLNAS